MPTQGFRYKAIIQNSNKDECNITVECDDENLLKFLHRRIEMTIHEYNARLVRIPKRVNDQCMDCKYFVVKQTVKTKEGDWPLYGCHLDNDTFAPCCKEFTKKER